MLNRLIQVLLILLFIFTPIAFGSVELWAFSLMELGILLIIILWAIQSLLLRTPHSEIRIPHSTVNKVSSFDQSAIRNPQSAMVVVLLSLFLLLVLFQMLPLPSGLLKILSPKTFELRNSLSAFDSQLITLNSKFQISLVPFVTQIEFFKWLTLSGFFLFLLYWRRSNNEIIHYLIPVTL